jgi:hypothetical protein
MTEVISGARGQHHYPDRREAHNLPSDMVGRGNKHTTHAPGDYVIFHAKHGSLRVEFRMYPDVVDGGRRYPDPRNLRAIFHDGMLRLHVVKDKEMIEQIRNYHGYGLGLVIWEEELMKQATMEARVRELKDNMVNPEFVASLKQSVSAQDFAFLQHLSQIPNDVTAADYEERLREAGSHKAARPAQELMDELNPDKPESTVPSMPLQGAPRKAKSNYVKPKPTARASARRSR